MFSKLSDLLPEEVSDEAAYLLISFLSGITMELESRYYGQMRRYIKSTAPPGMPVDWLEDE